MYKIHILCQILKFPETVITINNFLTVRKKIILANVSIFTERTAAIRPFVAFRYRSLSFYMSGD